jgi:hypothetical protein
VSSGGAGWFRRKINSRKNEWLEENPRLVCNSDHMGHGGIYILLAARLVATQETSNINKRVDKRSIKRSIPCSTAFEKKDLTPDLTLDFDHYGHLSTSYIPAVTLIIDSKYRRYGGPYCATKKHSAYTPGVLLGWIKSLQGSNPTERRTRQLSPTLILTLRM